MMIYTFSVTDPHPLLSSFQLMLLEHIIMGRLIMGNKSTAIQEVCRYQYSVYKISSFLYIVTMILLSPNLAVWKVHGLNNYSICIVDLSSMSSLSSTSKVKTYSHITVTYITGEGYLSKTEIHF